jgi:hypothetical protein
LSPLSPPPLKIAAAKLSQNLLQSLVNGRTQSEGFCLRD